MKNSKKIITLLIVSATGLLFIGGISVSAQTIQTGDATSETVVENVVNTNVIKCKECVSPTPTVPVETPTPTQPVETITPTNPPPQGDGGGEKPSEGGVGGPSAPSAPQGEVLGLSTTSGEGNMLFQIGKLVPSLFLGLMSLSFLKKNEKTKIQPKKRK